MVNSKTKIPLWRMAIYGFLLSVVNGTIIVANQSEWDLMVMLSGATACMIAWLLGTSNGLDVGRVLVIKRAQRELDAYYEKMNKDVEEFKAKINRRVNEGDEWKHSGGLDDAE